jgi:hypothetical protein
MTIAELHGKLSPMRPNGAHERMEDLLTSDVFSTMRYAGWSCGFLDWLLRAEVPSPLASAGTRIESLLGASSVVAIHVAFWPRLANGLEPDLALLIQRQADADVLAVVEAKYFSGTSDSGASGDEESGAGRTGFQIPDQIDGFAGMSLPELAAWFPTEHLSSNVHRVHLLITRDAYAPAPVYTEALARLPAPWQVSAFWLSWISLVDCLRPHRTHPDPGRAAQIQDLIDLLIRKDLVPFTGFQFAGWTTPSVTPSFWHEAWWGFVPPTLAASSSFWTTEAMITEAPQRRRAR